MIPAANRYTAVLDASVLFPNMKRDLLLRIYEADLYRAAWTEQIQQEWLTNAIAKYPDRTAQLRRTDALMREHFGAAWIEGHERFIETVVLPDPDDRHVVAAAIRGGAQYIVTDNIRDFPETALAALDIERGTADRFLAGTFEHYRHEALIVMREHRAGLRTRPSPSDYLMILTARGLPLLAAQLRPMRELI